MFKIKPSRKNKLDTDVLRENHKEFKRNNMLLLKSKQRFTRNQYLCLVNKLKRLQQRLCNNDKKKQPIDLC